MKDFRAKLVSVKELTADVRQFSFEPDTDFHFEAGQFVMIDIIDEQAPTASRAYSIASTPGSGVIELVIKLRDGRGSNFLRNLSEGDDVSMKGPFGHFAIDKSSGKDLVFIATGTGIAPINSMIRSLLESGDARKMRLFFGLRHFNDVFWREEFEKLAAEHENFDVILSLSRPDDSPWDGRQGRVTSIIAEENFDFSNIQVYLCGNKAMVDETKHFFVEHGVSVQDIRHEIF